MTAVFLIFDIVSAQLQVFLNLRLRRSLVKKSKLLAAHRYIFYVNALAAENSQEESGQMKRFMA
jgi:hypothetical protein